ncbi:MAG TPA: alpha/beta hydrolase-fold protein [Pyrinomonadaceae bacterium]|nr:alpha/beta hydrolase-fold protein [Pyrinomonadaceae bacterium]
MKLNLASVRSLGGVFAFLLLLSPAVFGQAPTGTLSKFTLKSEVLGEERTILVRTPPGYDTNSRKYPVLYMTDGDAQIGHTGSTIEFLARNGRISELIVVGITNTDRTRDLTPTHVTTSAASTGGTPQFPTSGGADKFLKFIESELIPDIEKRYRVQPYRILAGHSFGGLFAIHAMLSRPELFNSYVAVSPSLQWDDELLVKRAAEFFKARKEFKATLFVSLGNEPGPIGASFVDFKKLLAGTNVKGFDWQAEQLTDEDHGSVVLRSHYIGLRKIYEGWQLPRDPQTGAFAGDLKSADEHYKWLSQKFGYTIVTPENVINQLGYQSLQGGKADEAIAIFKSNVERYPESANVYDSLAEAYERNGRIDLAAPLYEKAQTLGQQNSDPNYAIYKANFERASDKLKQAEAAKKNQK